MSKIELIYVQIFKVVSFWGLRFGPPANISRSAPALNSLQRNQIYLYPKIVGDY